MESRKLYETRFKEQSEMYKGDKAYYSKMKDPDVIYQLELFLDNDGSLYRSDVQPAIKNMQRKLKSGKYDHKLAPKLWLNVIEKAAKMFEKDYNEWNDDSPNKKWQDLWIKKDREILAQKYADSYYDDIMAGEYD